MKCKSCEEEKDAMMATLKTDETLALKARVAELERDHEFLQCRYDATRPIVKGFETTAKVRTTERDAARADLEEALGCLEWACKRLGLRPGTDTVTALTWVKAHLRLSKHQPSVEGGK